MESTIQKIIDIIIKVREKITDDSDVIWTWYETPAELRNNIDKHLLELQNGDMNALEEFNLHFLPTCTFQEHSMSNGWSKEYLNLAEQFDRLYKNLKKKPSQQ